MTKEDKKFWAVELLRQKYKELERVPYKSDFEEPQRSQIKAYLGPWPRALETAGLKEPKPKVEKPKKRKKSAKQTQYKKTLKKEFEKENQSQSDD